MRYLKAITAIGVLALGALAFASPAHALGPQQCDNVGPGYCLNLWNGAGGSGYINAYQKGAANNQVSIQAIAGRCKAGSDYTTANCPYQSVPAGELIFQLVDEAGQCLGDYGNGSGDARLGGFDGCNNVNTGYGGGYGTVFFVYQASCSPGYNVYASFHWEGGAIGFNDSNGSAAYSNTQGNCLIEG